ncbi:hypothetical protein [Pedobacter sp. NJ-S-72]
MKKVFIYLLLLIICLFGCENKKPVNFVKVYDGPISDKEPDTVKNRTAISGAYYVFNYKDTDLKQLLKILDTITFDTSYRYYSYRFLKYNSSLPDTAKLKKAHGMIDFTKLDLESPGESKFYKYQILDFTYNRHYYNEGRHFPNVYTIEFNTKGSIKSGIKYYLKDSLTKKLREIPIEVLYPHINNPH